MIITTEKDHSNLNSLFNEVQERGYSVACANWGGKDNFVIIDPSSLRGGLVEGACIMFAPPAKKLPKGTRVLVENK